jgi:hypothetical protein
VNPKEEAAALQRQAQRLTYDQWQAFTTHEAAKAAGKWLEAKGGLGRPIAALTMRDLEGLVEAAISRWIVLSSHRLAQHPDGPEDLGWMVLGI